MQVSERIMEALEYFAAHEKTFMNWLNDTQKSNNDEDKFFDVLFSQGFLAIAGIEYVPLGKGRDKHTSLYNTYSNYIIYVTKDGYSFLNAYKFNKQSMELNLQSLAINKSVKIWAIASFIIACVSLVVALVQMR